jgi:hypothetical protein
MAEANALTTRSAEQALDLVGEAERAILAATTATEAEEVWRRVSAVDEAARIVRAASDVQAAWARTKLRAERRWGELLGPAGTGRPEGNVTASHVSPPAARKTHQRVRDVAKVPEPAFEKFLGRKDPDQLTRAKLLRAGREAEAEQRRAEPVASVSSIDGVEIRHGDLRTALADLAGQVDAIITDPPYPAEFIPEFDALGELATSLLKPSGLLVAMVGQTHLPAYLAALGRHLTYRWCGAYLTDGPATRIHARAVGTKWKPLLIYGGERFITQDVFASCSDDKRHHHWGQSESGMADVVERLTEPGALVVDPFLGGGTTAVVCEALGRRFIGCDVDAAAVSTARERFAA